MNATAFPLRPTSRAPVQRVPLSRNAVIALTVVGLHVLFIWALQSGLLMRAAEIIVPAEILVQFVNPPAPKVEEQPKPVPPKPVPAKKQAAKAPAKPTPQPLAINDPTPSPNAPTGVTTPVVAAAPAPAAAETAAPAAPPAPPAPPVIQLPSSDADYLQNPLPSYPPLSRRLNEKGVTTVRVLIGVDGLPQRAEIAKSSGYDRLDQAASSTVMRWRFVPGKRNGVAEAMWFNVPVRWVLE